MAVYRGIRVTVAVATRTRLVSVWHISLKPTTCARQGTISPALLAIARKADPVAGHLPRLSICEIRVAALAATHSTHDARAQAPDAKKRGNAVISAAALMLLYQRRGSAHGAVTRPRGNCISTVSTIRARRVEPMTRAHHARVRLPIWRRRPGPGIDLAICTDATGGISANLDDGIVFSGGVGLDLFLSIERTGDTSASKVSDPYSVNRTLIASSTPTHMEWIP